MASVCSGSTAGPVTRRWAGRRRGLRPRGRRASSVALLRRLVAHARGTAGCARGLAQLSASLGLAAGRHRAAKGGGVWSDESGLGARKQGLPARGVGGFARDGIGGSWGWSGGGEDQPKTLARTAGGGRERDRRVAVECGRKYQSTKTCIPTAFEFLTAVAASVSEWGFDYRPTITRRGYQPHDVLA